MTIQCKTIALLILLSTAAAAPAQNLLQDGKRLLDESNCSQDTAVAEDARRNAAQEVLTILARYDGPMQGRARNVSAAYQVRLLEKAQANPLLRGLLPEDSLLRIGEQVNALSGILPVQDEAESNRGRKRIEAIMYGGAPTSPAQYLSVQQSLQNSQVPPLQNSAAIQSAAQNAQAPLSLTGLGVQGVTQEVFEFLLKRAKEEVAISFLDHLLFRKIAEVDSELFGNVRKRFGNPADISSSQSFLESLREAFFLDLRSLPLNLSKLLFAGHYFGALQDEPAFYGVMTAYNLFGLSKNGTMPWESMPLAHRGLYDRFEAADKNLNIRLAADQDSFFVTEEYRQMQGAAREYVEKMGEITSELYDIEKDIRQLVRDNEKNNSEISNSGNESESGPVFDTDPLFDYWVLTGRIDENAAFHLGLLPELLDGELTERTITYDNTLESFDKFFVVPYSKQEMRLAGLELARRLVDGSWYSDLTQVEILRRWQAALDAYRAAVDWWIIKSDSSRIEAEFAATEVQRQALHDTIVSMRSYWREMGEPANLQALLKLQSIAGPFTRSSLDSLDILDERQRLLRGIEQRLALVERRLAEKNGAAAADSPYQLYLRQQASQSIETQETKLRTLLIEVDALQALAEELRKALNRLDSLKAPEENRAIEGVRPMLQATELLSAMYSVFYDNDEQELIAASDFEDMLYQPELRAVCMGLLQQRLSRIKGLSTPSPDALAQYAQFTLNDFSTLKNALGGSFREAAPESSQLFQIASAGLQVLNRTLTFPLFADGTQRLVSLSEIHPSLKHVPEISEQCLMLLYNLEANQYRPAIGAMVRLLGSMGEQLEAGRLPSGENQKTLLTFFSKYGDFIAGLVDAQSPFEMEHLLAGLAAPPGSARTKRTHRLSASLNAYVGMTAGRERLTRGKSTSSDFFFAPTIPIGPTVSWLCFSKSKKPQSFSLHLTAIDLGAMLAYRQIDEEEFGTEKLSFKNIVQPGIQFHWNIQKSPLYLGLGWQSGPQFREEDGREIALRSCRVFLAGGVDIPAFSLFARKERRK